MVIWLLLSLFATGFSLAGVLDTIKDKRALAASGKNGLRKELVKGQLRSEILRTVGLGIFLIVGLIAGLNPPGVIIAWLLIAANAIFGFKVWIDWRLRAHLRDQIAAMHTAYDEAISPPDQE